jgi:exodeoxyribonuclease V gamma subunit
VPVEVLREAWLDGVDSPGSGRRFLAGGVTFCTLMPLRAVPFKVVCLLGMNDGDYPRATRRSDFDLLGLPGQARPGDRSRRDDDRYLMLEALLSARRVLYVSWAGRSARDNSEQPPSVLVAQLRDYLAAGWRAAGQVQDERPSAEAAKRLLHQLSTDHPLQPFSRRYFENALPPQGDLPVGQLLTYAREWRAAHAPLVAATTDNVLTADESDAAPITLKQLTRFIKNPVKEFFRARLHVVFPDDELALVDDETFGLAGLDDWAVLAELTADPHTIASAADVPALVQTRLARVRGAGRLPMAGLGQRVADELSQSAVPMLRQWQQLHARYDQPVTPLSLRFEHAGVVLEDWLDGLRGSGPRGDGLHGGGLGNVDSRSYDTSRDDPRSDSGNSVWIGSSASRIMTKLKKSGRRDPRYDKLVDAWLRLVVATACAGPHDPPVQAILLGRDACLKLAAPAQDDAIAVLRHLLQAWRDGMAEPLPCVCKTAIAQVLQEREIETYEGSDFGGGLGDVREPCLARVYPDYDALTADGRSLHYAELLFGPLLAWTADHVTELPWAEAPALHETGDDEAGDSHD